MDINKWITDKLLHEDESIGFNYKDLFEPQKIDTYDVTIKGWLVLDDNDDLWFFPGIDNKPVKENGEWVGICPFHIEDHGIIKEELKVEPKFIALRS